MIQVVILAGGPGENLWPLSRQKMPKQFLKLLDNDMSLFQITVNRFITLKKKYLEYEFKLTVVCNDSNKFLVKQQALEIEEFNFDIIAEPINRKTTAAITSALELFNDEDMVLVIPSDQIWDENEFCECVLKLLLKNHEGISFIGVKPYYPATRFGYLKSKDGKLISFKEKPTYDESMTYINSEDSSYYWNSGVLFFMKKTMIDEISKNYKDIILNIKTVMINSDSNDSIISLNKSLFENIDSVSIDFGVLEKYKNGFVIDYNNYWIDIDNYKSLFDFLQKDINYNLLKTNDENNIVTIDTENCLIHSDHKLVTTIGISNMVIIDTRDSLLVAEKNASLNVSEIVKILKSRSRSEHIVNPICYKPWGWFINLDGSDFSGFKVKKICVYAKNRLSLQSHKERSEHWVIIKGTAKIQLGEDFQTLNVNQSLYIPKGVKHRLENIGDEDVEFIETQVGSYIGEDDIERYDDDFGR